MSDEADVDGRESKGEGKVQRQGSEKEDGEREAGRRQRAWLCACALP
jgi:hypothetical protein